MARVDGSRLAGAIYGTIVVLAVIAGVSEDTEAGAASVLGALLVTALALWIAHVYAESLASRLVDPEVKWREIVRRAIAQEWPLAQAALVPAVPLLLGALGVLSRDTAIDVAMALALADLFAWGVAVGRASDQPRGRAVLSGLLNVALGAIVVGLKLLVH
jgi:VIT1/CCC1 family predicted Fe2+/Mn2+ transporter